MFLKNRVYENVLVNKNAPSPRLRQWGKGDVMKEAQVCLLVVFVVGVRPTILRHWQLLQNLHHLNYQHLSLGNNVLLR